MKAITAAEVAVPEQDLDLVERHRYGDPDAFEELYARYGTMVYNLALRLCHNREEAADLTQESFLRIYRHLAKFRGGSALKTWIYRVTLNHCRSRLGRKRLPFQPLTADTARRVSDESRTPEELAVAEDQSRRVAEALGRLPARFREAVVLRDLEGLSYQEIAEVLRVRIGTVRSRIARGREQLRGELETGR
jgi:RNA polymerase sigma-70 factor (ECF subfamily)